MKLLTQMWKKTPPKLKFNLRGDGRLVAWLGAHKSQSFGHETILDSLERLGANSIEWSTSEDLQLPNEQLAPCVSAPISSTLGWLVSLGSDRPDLKTWSDINLDGA